jgi:hypothetical protein
MRIDNPPAASAQPAVAEHLKEGADASKPAARFNIAAMAAAAGQQAALACKKL